jgi:hypothetical protein
MAHAVETELYIPSESERVICWRASELIAAGFDTPAAVEIAERPDVDLHAALELLARGCPADVAANILL